MGLYLLLVFVNFKMFKYIIWYSWLVLSESYSMQYIHVKLSAGKLSFLYQSQFIWLA